MEQIKKIEWNEKYSVDIEEIDELQKKMFALFNVLIELKTKDADAKACANMISDIYEYGKYFFYKEEEYLKERNFPDLEAHAKEHRYFIKHTINLRREVAENQENLTYDIIKKMEEWLSAHILEKDMLYVPFLRVEQFIEMCEKKN